MTAGAPRATGRVNGDSLHGRARTRRGGRGVVALATGFAVVLLAMVALMLGHLAWHGLPALGPSLLFGDVPPIAALTGREPVVDGLLPALIGSLVLVLLANAVAQPLGIATGLWLSEYLRGRSRAAALFAVNVLAAVPSIVIGLFGFALLLLLRATVAPGANASLLLAAGCLAILVLPYTVNATVASLAALPQATRMAGASLGLSRGQALRHVLLPASRRGIMGGSVLAVGRSSEDVAVIMLTGAVASAGMPQGLGDRFEALPFFIFHKASEYRGPEDLQAAFAAALLLLALAGGLFMLGDRWMRSLDRAEAGR
jgi:phosphate transport system permease protein